MYKINVDKLLRNELEYEVKIRGIEPSGTVDSLRKCLRSLMHLENSGNVMHSSFEQDTEGEIQSCTEKLTELKLLIDAFSGSSSHVSKIETKIAHLTGRINRLSEKSSEDREKRSDLLVQLTSFVSQFEDREKALKQAEFMPPLDPHFDVGNLFISSPIRQATGSNSNSVENIGENGSVPAVVSPINSSIRNSTNRFVPVYKWDLKFSGQSDLSFNAFLQRVEELSRSRGVSKDELFGSAVDLFEGQALNYYQLISRYASGWDSLIKLMKDEFVPHNFSDKLWNQILNRTQGSDEPIGIYVAAMSQLFDRMQVSVPDSLRLKVLRNNILPFYQERLVLQEVSTPFELINLCRRLEETRIRVGEFKPPQRGIVYLEPDLDYCGKAGLTQKPEISEINSSMKNLNFSKGRSENENFRKSYSSDTETSTDSFRNSREQFRENRDKFRHTNTHGENFENRNSHRRDRNQNDSRRIGHSAEFGDDKIDRNRDTSTANRQTGEKLCYKCNQPNHFAKNCTSKIRKCFSCGKLNVTVNTCPNCRNMKHSKNRQENGRRGQF